MLGSIEVRDYMNPDPVKIDAGADVFEAISLIREHRISGLCVVDAEGQLVGVLSELDCLEAILSAAYDERTAVGTVGEYMTRDVVTANVNDDILKVAGDMLKNKHRRRPVLDHGRLVGQITCRQLLGAVKDFPGRDRS
ncbi:CBS domain-containing protein [Gilvimarinus sp. F26214L]|uniref:CBS domain-containing protein n=1 Tax=Gilvimarinus sp. DZF01 TaxID=3461371 RepID=UPI0040459650